MTSRVFISYRSSDGTDKATALARDLDELFGQEQIFLDKEDLPAGSRWRDVIVKTLNASPILLVLVTPNYLDARSADGGRCIDRADDPVRGELEAAVGAGAHIIPLICDGLSAPPAGHLPAPFDQLIERTWRRLRAYDWRNDVARLADDLRSLGLVPRDAPAGREPITVPMPAGSVPESVRAALLPAEAVPPSRRGFVVAAAALLVLGGAGAGAWTWWQGRPLTLAGRWRASIGKRGATSSRDGEVVMVTIEQTGENLRVASSAVDVERDPDWQNYRDFWKQATGRPLGRVFYRGEGVIRADESDGVTPDVPRGPHRVVVAVRIDVPEASEPIDRGALRGAVDPDGNRIRGRLWLNSEQGERVVDLRREP